MPRTRSSRRALVAFVVTVAVAVGAGAFLVMGPSAVAAVPDERPVTPAAPAVVGPGAIGQFATTLTTRAGESARALAQAAAPAPPPRVYCPAPGSEFVDSWGFARSGGRHHQGVDMMAPGGTPVIAPFSGTVRPSHSALGGLGFYLLDDAGNEYFGGHLRSLDVVGPVAAGTQIGTVGRSGNADATHLHFEVHPGAGPAVDPYPYVASWCTQDPTNPWAPVLVP